MRLPPAGGLSDIVRSINSSDGKAEILQASIVCGDCRREDGFRPRRFGNRENERARLSKDRDGEVLGRRVILLEWESHLAESIFAILVTLVADSLEDALANGVIVDLMKMYPADRDTVMVLEISDPKC